MQGLSYPEVSQVESLTDVEHERAPKRESIFLRSSPRSHERIPHLWVLCYYIHSRWRRVWIILT